MKYVGSACRPSTRARVHDLGVHRGPRSGLPRVWCPHLGLLSLAGGAADLVAVSGRPYALGQYQGRAAAIVQAFFPGEEGGAALAGVLSGRVNPSGTLPVEVPRHAGGQPHTYLATPLAQNSQGVSSLEPTPAFPFGHGLSYTAVHSDRCRSGREIWNALWSRAR